MHSAAPKLLFTLSVATTPAALPSPTSPHSTQRSLQRCRNKPLHKPLFIHRPNFFTVSSVLRSSPGQEAMFPSPQLQQDRPVSCRARGFGESSKEERGWKGEEEQGQRDGARGTGGRGAKAASYDLDLSEFARPADRVWDISKPQVYYFAIANAHSLLADGALLEEVLSDAITRCNRGGRPRDVWMVMDPAFLDHPSLATLKAALKPPTAALLSTNGPWMMSTVRELLPQASIGKFSAPTSAIPNPFESNLEPGGAVIGGGAVWH